VFPEYSDKWVREKKELWSYEDTYRKLSSITVLRDKAFLCLVYAAMARVGEIVWHYKRVNPPLSKDDIELKEDKIVVTVLTEKVNMPRRVPISLVREGKGSSLQLEGDWLVKPILKYAELCDDYLFSFTTRWGEMLFEKYFDSQHIHLLRMWRQTHLLQGKVTGSPLPRTVVARMAGITDLSTLDKHYDLSIMEDYEHLI